LVLLFGASPGGHATDLGTIPLTAKAREMPGSQLSDLLKIKKITDTPGGIRRTALAIPTCRR
jgi:hypothetical protein